MEQEFVRYKNLLNTLHMNDNARKKRALHSLLAGIHQEIKHKIKPGFTIFRVPAPQVRQQQVQDLLKSEKPLGDYIEILLKRKQIRGRIQKQQVAQIVNKHLKKSVDDAKKELEQAKKLIKKLSKSGPIAHSAKHTVQTFPMRIALSTTPRAPTHQPGTENKKQETKPMTIQQFGARLQKLKR